MSLYLLDLTGSAGVFATILAISTIYQPVVNTCIPILVPEKHLVRANAIIQQAALLSNFLGPILAGVLYGGGTAFATLCIPLGQILFGGLIELFTVNLYWLLGIAAFFVFVVTLLVRWNVLQIKENSSKSNNTNRIKR